MDYRKEYRILPSLTGEGPGVRYIKEYLNSIIGTHALPLAPSSAKKTNGRKLYEYARE